MLFPNLLFLAFPSSKILPYFCRSVRDGSLSISSDIVMGMVSVFTRGLVSGRDVVSPGQPELRRGDRLPVIRNLEPRGKPMHYGLGSCDE